LATLNGGVVDMATSQSSYRAALLNSSLPFTLLGTTQPDYRDHLQVPVLTTLRPPTACFGLPSRGEPGVSDQGPDLQKILRCILRLS